MVDWTIFVCVIIKIKFNLPISPYVPSSRLLQSTEDVISVNLVGQRDCLTPLCDYHLPFTGGHQNRFFLAVSDFWNRRDPRTSIQYLSLLAETSNVTYITVLVLRSNNFNYHFDDVRVAFIHSVGRRSGFIIDKSEYFVRKSRSFGGTACGLSCS